MYARPSCALPCRGAFRLAACIGLFGASVRAAAVDVTVAGSMPILETLDAAIAVEGDTPIDISLALAYDAKGKLLCASACTVDGAPVSVKGSVKGKDGVFAYVLVVSSADPKVKLKIAGLLDDDDSVAAISYAGPRGKLTLAAQPVTLGLGTSSIELELRPGVSPEGAVSGTASLDINYGPGGGSDLPLAGAVKGDALQWAWRDSARTFAFKGVRAGPTFRGTLKIKAPPLKLTLVDFEVADLRLAEIQSAIDELAPGAWLEIPDSHMRSVGWRVEPAFPFDVAEVIKAASGGTFDTKRNRMIVFGGGQIYAGNEIYAFDLDDARWERLTDPSPFPPGEESNPNNLVQHPDGAPVSRHSYDHLAYIPDPVDRLFLGGGSALWFSGQFEDDHTYYFDFETRTWELRSDTPSGGVGAACAVGPDGRVWQQGGQNLKNHLSVYDPSGDAWTEHVEFPTWYDPYSTAEIDPVRQRFVAVGNGATWVWNLEDPDAAPVQLATIGAREIEDTPAPGLAYHPPSGRLIAWNGFRDVYALDLDTAAWTVLPEAGDVDPGPAATRGTWGRFAYVPSRDVFIEVSSVDRNVFIYRLP